MIDPEELAKSNQEQAVASWVSYLNQLRVDGFETTLRQQDVNLQDALASIDEAIRRIDLEVVTRNRGGDKGMHGFIAEVAEVGVGNARSRILGKGSVYEWVNDNGPADLIRSGTEIQQKFVAAGGRFSLAAVTEHLAKYPDFVANGGKYQIPADHFNMVRTLHDMTPEEATSLLTRSGDGPSLRDWQRIQAFFDDDSLSMDSLEPSMLKYPEVQRGAYDSTLQAERQSLQATDQVVREDAYNASRPKSGEGAKATIVAAAVEGTTAFVLAVAEKRRGGKQFKEFTRDDWTEIAAGTGFSFVKGGVRGLTIYSLTNFTATPAAVASSLVTAAFRIAEQAHRLRTGEISELEFIENSELAALEVAVSGLSSFLGQALIPIPILGAVIGNSVGMVMYTSVSAALSRREAELLTRYLDEQRALDDILTADYQELIDRLNASMADYLELLGQAFSIDPETALLGSVELALTLGVAGDEVIDSDDKRLAYFLD
ncbi:hypothetical protein [Tessaracoccus lacteus]|uniref:Uncharacterized protein n=1 Tax=Tessaracoccus lacteus TaxID=3041766 RepID=A0ABY8PXQ6_9ACTN|nr:hypothetical protein [Tessaracoccus sp. T21]WGT47297.1 hypothetical protein QH948_00480 [Tessaracoccus sp. T21]